MSLSINTVFLLRLKGKVPFPVVLFWNLKDFFLSVIPNVGDSQTPEFGMASSVSWEPETWCEQSSGLIDHEKKFFRVLTFELSCCEYWK